MNCCGLHVTGYGLRVAGYELRGFGMSLCRLPAAAKSSGEDGSSVFCPLPAATKSRRGETKTGRLTPETSSRAGLRAGQESAAAEGRPILIVVFINKELLKCRP